MNDIKDKAILFVRPYVKQGLDRTRSIQIPVKAHTSTNGKLGIAVALFFSVTALVSVAGLYAKEISRHRSKFRLGKHSHHSFYEDAASEVESASEDVAKDAKEAVKKAKNKLDIKAS